MTPKIVQKYQKKLSEIPQSTLTDNGFDRSFMASKEYLVLYNLYKKDNSCDNKLYEIFKGLRDSNLTNFNRSLDVFCHKLKQNFDIFDKTFNKVVTYVPGEENLFYELPSYFGIDSDWDTNDYYPKGLKNNRFLNPNIEQLNNFKSKEPDKDFGNSTFIKTFDENYQKCFVDTGYNKVGLVADLKETINKKFNGEFRNIVLRTNSIPAVMDLRQIGLTTYTMSQGSCGSCPYNALSAVIETLIRYEIIKSDLGNEIAESKLKYILDQNFHISIDSLMSQLFDGVVVNGCNGTENSITIYKLMTTSYDKNCQSLPFNFKIHLNNDDKDEYEKNVDNKSVDVYKFYGKNICITNDCLDKENDEECNRKIQECLNNLDYTYDVFDLYKSRNIFKNFDKINNEWKYKNEIKTLPFHVDEDAIIFGVTDENTAMILLAFGVPLQASMIATGSFDDKTISIKKLPCSSDMELDHIVTIMGYTVDENGNRYYMIKNSHFSNNINKHNAAYDGYFYTPMSQSENNFCIYNEGFQAILPKSLQDKLLHNKSYYGLQEIIEQLEIADGLKVKIKKISGGNERLQELFFNVDMEKRIFYGPKYFGATPSQYAGFTENDIVPQIDTIFGRRMLKRDENSDSFIYSKENFDYVNEKLLPNENIVPLSKNLYFILMILFIVLFVILMITIILIITIPKCKKNKISLSNLNRRKPEVNLAVNV